MYLKIVAQMNKHCSIFVTKLGKVSSPAFYQHLNIGLRYMLSSKETTDSLLVWTN